MSVKHKRYSSEQVCAILCDGCKLKIPEVFQTDKRRWIHKISGQAIPCDANAFRISSFYLCRINSTNSCTKGYSFLIAINNPTIGEKRAQNETSV